MNSLVTLGMDRNGLLRDGLRVGMVYPGIQALSADKAREGAVAVALGYDHIPDLHYKPDVSLESRKPSNGYVGLYKSPPPGLPKPLLVPGAGADSLGLDRRVGPPEKHSDLGLNGSSGYLRLPWVSPYPEAGMYPYLDTKYAALSMYKASLMSQPTPPYLPQHLAYQSLCAGAGGASAERLFYLPPYPPAPISSPLAPPLRIPTATVAPAALSPLVHCQEKGMQSLGPRIHHEPHAPASAFGQQLHHQTHGERSHGERPLGNRSHGERPHGERPHGERPHGERPHGERPYSDRSQGERPISDRSHGERTHGDRSHGERPYSDRSQGERPHGERPHGERAHGDRSHGERPHGERSHGERSHSERPHGERSHGERPHGERPHGERSHGERSHGERSHSSSKSGRAPSIGSNLPPDSTPSLLMPSPRTPARLSQPPSLIDSTLDFQKPLPRVLPPSSSSSSPLMSHPFYINTMVGVAQEHTTPAPAPAPPPAMSTSHKPKSREGSSERRGNSGCGVDRKSSKSPLERPQTDKPLDLSAKLGDFEAPPNGFSHKMEVLAKLSGHSPTARYNLPPSRELLKETLSSSSSSSSSNSNLSPLTVSTSSKSLDRPEIISTLHSTWVVPSPGPTHNPSHSAEANQTQAPPTTVIKNRKLEQVAPQQRSSSCPRIGEPNGSQSSANPPPTGVITPTGRPASTSPSPNMNSEWPKPGCALPEKAPTPNQSSSGKPPKPSQRPEIQELAYKSQHPSHLENGHGSGHLYLPQNEAFLPPTLAYANRYLSYSVPDGMALPHLPLPAKGPVYPHPVLLGSSSLYPAHLAAPKPGLPYGLPTTHSEFLTYHDSQEMVHPLMSPHLTLDPKTAERPERRARPQDKPQRGAEPADLPQKAERAAPKPLPPGPKLQAKQPPQSPIAGRDRATGCIVDRVRVDTKAGPPSAAQGDGDRASLLSDRNESNEGMELEEQGVPLPPAADRQPHVSPSRPIPHSPDRMPPDQTLRCARTSGDRSGEIEAHGTRRYLKTGREDNQADQESHEEEEDDDDDEGGQECSRTWKSSLAKRIANSSGYVGDRFKYVTTELYADSSKLSREQRALQRAMMRFSELELKEKEGGAVAGRELADGQGTVEGEWEGCPHIARFQGVAIAEEAERDGMRVAPSGPYGGNRVPVLQRCGVLRELRDQRPGQEEVGPGGVAARKRSLHPEKPQEGEGDWEMAVLQAKRSRQSGDVWLEGDSPPPPKCLQAEVKDLKVRIELTGLSLRQPCPPLPPPAGKRPEVCRSGDPQPGLPTPREEADTPPATPSQDPAQPLEKRQRLKEQHRGGLLGVTSLEEAAPGGDSAPRLHRHGDLQKPKGKRQCKTKHISLRERAQIIEETTDPHPDPEQKVCPEQPLLQAPASPLDCRSSPPSPVPAAPHTPLQKLTPQPSPPPAGNPPADTPASRPMPPEARRLIVNKNAGETLLQRAARLGYEEVVLYCLENKVCDVNHRDNAGYCALHEACARGWLSIVQHLVEHGADINCSAQDGTRPLHDAVENDHLDVVRLLLSYGADPTLATYSGRGLLKMTHSDLMESFLSDYFADLQGRRDDDPGLCWEFYGSSVCEPADDPTAFDILANPPGPGPDEEEQREVFEFEFSDRPLLPCYNIQVSLSQGPRNWLLLSDVLKRLRMPPAAFRAAFPHIDVVTVAEAEFYRQASLSQLFSCPEELEGFTPDSKELLDLVEISAELATQLGSSLECLDNHWDSVAMERS